MIAKAEPRDLMLRFLASIGRPNEAEQYLAGLAGDLRGKGLTVETRVRVGVPVEAISAGGRSNVSCGS